MSDSVLDIDELLNSCTDEKRVNLIKLTQHVAILTNEMTHQKSDISDLKKQGKDTHDIVTKMNSKLFVDNGNTSIITQFKNNDITLANNQAETDKKVNELTTTVGIIADRKERKERFKKWLIPITVSAALSIIGILISVNVIKSVEQKKYINNIQPITKGIVK